MVLNPILRRKKFKKEFGNQNPNNNNHKKPINPLQYLLLKYKNLQNKQLISNLNLHLRKDANRIILKIKKSNL